MKVNKSFAKKFQPAFEKVKQLQLEERYLGAFIFGSIARGDATKDSDFDVKVVVNQHNPCKNINHPVMNGVKLDITFQSFGQLQEFTKQEIKRAERIPMVAESTIIFDKTGEITKLRQKAQKAKPRKATAENYQLIQFMIYHANNKVERSLDNAPRSALLSMGININDILKNHYEIQGKWRVSDKRLLSDLKQWDPQLAVLLERFSTTNEVSLKFAIWSEIIDHILKPIGGRQPISENNCDCAVCKEDLKNFDQPKSSRSRLGKG